MDENKNDTANDAEAAELAAPPTPEPIDAPLCGDPEVLCAAGDAPDAVLFAGPTDPAEEA